MRNPIDYAEIVAVALDVVIDNLDKMQTDYAEHITDDGQARINRARIELNLAIVAQRDITVTF